MSSLIKLVQDSVGWKLDGGRRLTYPSAMPLDLKRTTTLDVRKVEASYEYNGLDRDMILIDCRGKTENLGFISS